MKTTTRASRRAQFPQVDTTDLPVVKFIPLDCNKQAFKHLKTNPERKIITLGGDRGEWRGGGDE